jgi:hypothetical protein
MVSKKKPLMSVVYILFQNPAVRHGGDLITELLVNKIVYLLVFIQK